MAPIFNGDNFVYQNIIDGNIYPREYAQARPILLGIGIAKTDKGWGAVSNEDGSEVIPFEYEGITFLNKKCIKATKAGQHFLFNLKGDQVGEKSYNDLAVLVGYSDTLVACNSQGKYGLIDSKGVEVIPFVFEKPPAHLLSGHLNFIQLNAKKYGDGIVDLKGNTIVPFKYFHIREYRNYAYKCTRFDGQHDYYSTIGKLLFSEKKGHKVKWLSRSFIVVEQEGMIKLTELKSGNSYSFNNARQNSLGYELVLGYDSLRNSTNLFIEGERDLRVKGEWIAQGSHHGLIQMNTKVNGKGRTGLMDLSGKFILPAVFSRIQEWSDEIAIVSNSRNGVSIYDLKQKKIIGDSIYLKVQLANFGLVKIYSDHKTYRVVDKKLNDIDLIPSDKEIAENDHVLLSNDELRNLARTFNSKRNNPALFNLTYQKTLNGPIKDLPFEYFYLLTDRYAENPIPNRLLGRYRVAENGVMTQYTILFDFDGRVLLPQRYNIISGSGDGVYVASMNKMIDGEKVEKWGAIDEDGNEVIPVKFQKIERIIDDVAIVKENGALSLYNMNTNESVIKGYDKIYYRENGYFSLMKDGFYGLAKSSGELLVAAKYNEVAAISLHPLIIVGERDKVRYYIDNNGNEYLIK